MLNVFPGLVRTEWSQSSHNRYPLSELSEVFGGKSFGQLGLTRENDLHQLLARGFKIRKHPDKLEHSIVEILGLINDHNDLAPTFGFLKQIGI